MSLCPSICTELTVSLLMLSVTATRLKMLIAGLNQHTIECSYVNMNVLPFNILSCYAALSQYSYWAHSFTLDVDSHQLKKKINTESHPQWWIWKRSFIGVYPPMWNVSSIVIELTVCNLNYLGFRQWAQTWEWLQTVKRSFVNIEKHILLSLSRYVTWAQFAYWANSLQKGCSECVE